SVVGYKFHVRDLPVDYSKGFTFDLNGSRLKFYGMNTGDFNYDLGTDNNMFSRLWVNRLRVSNDFLVHNAWNSEIGWRMETQYSGDGHGISLYPTYTGNYNYVIGKKNNKLTNVYSQWFTGSVDSESSHNAKMNIEDVDSQTAF